MEDLMEGQPQLPDLHKQILDIEVKESAQQIHAWVRRLFSLFFFLIFFVDVPTY